MANSNDGAEPSTENARQSRRGGRGYVRGESTTTDREHFTLPERRTRLDVVDGGRGVVHVVEHSTWPADAHPGRWTRRAAQRQAFCGSLSACVVGVDAADWPTERVAPDLRDVTCKRCRARAERVFRPSEL